MLLALRKKQGTRQFVVDGRFVQQLRQLPASRIKFCRRAWQLFRLELNFKLPPHPLEVALHHSGNCI